LPEEQRTGSNSTLRFAIITTFFYQQPQFQPAFSGGSDCGAVVEK